MDKHRSTLGHLSAFITIFIWGATFISTKVLLTSFSPVEILCIRLVLAYLVLLCVSPHFIKVKNIKEELMFAACGLCGVTLYFVFQNTALTYTLTTNVSILVSISPFFTALLSRWFLKEEIFRTSFFIGFAVSISGIILIGYNGNFILKLNPLGDILAILCGVVWAFYSIVFKKLSARQYNTIQLTRRIFFYGFIFLIPFLNPSNFQLNLARFASLPNVLNLLFLGISASALAYVTWNYALSVLGAVKTSIYIYVIPIVTIAVSAIFLKEPITVVAVIGVLLILSGLYLSTRQAKSTK